MVSVIFRASGSATASITTENAPACATARASFSIGSQRRPRSRPWARNEPSVLIDCGVRPIWPITGMPRSDKKRDGLRHPRAAFELHRAAMGFLQDAHGGMKRLLLRGLIGAERHVDHDQRVLRAAHHRVALQDHHLERHRHRGLETVHHIAEEVADQNDVAIAIDQRRGMRVIRGQHHDRLAVLAGANIRRGLALDGGLN